jgi:hypothetical protein
MAAVGTLLAGLTIWQWSGGNIAIQVGGSQNHIEQKTDTHLTTQTKK